jgi:hypothetical protein
MAASLFIEEESGTYTARFRRHPHNGYYAGDFSQQSRAGSELRVCYAERRDVACARQWWRTDGANASTSLRKTS